jgi:hypothetical protein
MSLNTLDNALPADWADVLDRIQRSLDQTLATVVLPPEEEPTPSPWQSLAQETGERLRQRRQQLDARIARTRQTAQQLEALLVFEAEALNAWLAAAAEVKQHLARSASRAIS